MPEPLQSGENSEGGRPPHADPPPDSHGGNVDDAQAGAPLGSPHPAPEARRPESGRPAAAPTEADVQQTDDDEAGPLQQLDPRWVTAERISGAIGALVLSTGALVAVLVFGAGWRLLGLGAWAILAVALFAGAIIGPAMQYRRARYRVTPFGIEIHWGILWRRITIVPRSRIQHTDVEQGPLLRKFGLAKLVIHTAGAEHSTVPVYGLPMPRASAIRDDLMGRAAQPGQPAAGPPAPAGAGGARHGAGDGI